MMIDAIQRPAFLSDATAKRTAAAETPPPTRSSLTAAIKRAEDEFLAKLPALEQFAAAAQANYEKLHAETVAAQVAAIAAGDAVRVARVECRNAKDRAERLLRETASPLIAETRAALVPIERELQSRSYSSAFERAIEAVGRGAPAPDISTFTQADGLVKVLADAREELARLEVSDVDGAALRNRLKIIWTRVEVAAGRRDDN